MARVFCVLDGSDATLRREITFFDGTGKGHEVVSGGHWHSSMVQLLGQRNWSVVDWRNMVFQFEAGSCQGLDREVEELRAVLRAKGLIL